MYQYNQYLVSDTDQFNPENFPDVNLEILKINTATAHLPSFYKAEMIVSFLKDHSLHKDWIKYNPRLAKLITSRILFSGNIEFLFEACRNNPVFRQHFETYLTEKFSEPSVVSV